VSEDLGWAIIDGVAVVHFSCAIRADLADLVRMRMILGGAGSPSGRQPGGSEGNDGGEELKGVAGDGEDVAGQAVGHGGSLCRRGGSAAGRIG